MSIKPVEIDILVKGDKTKSVLSEMDKQADVLQAAIRQVTVAVEELRTTPSPDLSQEENIAQVEMLERQIVALKKQYAQLYTEVDGAPPIVPPDLDGQTKKFNGLSMSVQQLARELPSLAYGPQMFFMAISNNLPIFTDEVARANAEYNALVASGQKGIPVWQQIAKSIFSPQSAIVAITMLLVTQGDAIVEWIGTLGEAKKSIEELAGVTSMLDDALLQGNINAQSEMVRMQTLQSAAQSEILSRKERLEAVKALQSEFPSYFSNLAQEAILEGDVADAYTRTAESILAKSRAQALSNQMVSNSEIITSADDELTALRSIGEAYAQVRSIIEQEVASGGYRGLGINTQVVEVLGQTVSGTSNSIVGQLDELSKQYIDDIKSKLSDVNQQLASELINDRDVSGSVSNVITYFDSLVEKNKEMSAEIVGLMGQYAEDEAIGGRKVIKTEQDFAAELLRLQLANEQSRIDLMAEGSAKRQEQIKLNYAQEIAELEAQEREWRKAQGGALTQEQQQALGESRELAQRQAAQESLDAAIEENRLAQEKSLAVIKELQQKTLTLDDERAALTSEFTKNLSVMLASPEQFDQGNIDKLTADYNAAIEALNTQAAESTDAFAGLFADASRKSVEELQSIIDQAELLYEFLSAGEYSQVQGGIFGISASEFDSLQNVETLDAVRKRIEELRKQYDELSGSVDSFNDAFSKMSEGMRNNDIDTFNEGLKYLDSKVGASTKLLSGFADILTNIGELTNSDGFTKMGEGLEDAVSVLEGTLSGAASGSALGPVGAIVGGAIGLIGSITSVFADNKQEQDEYNEKILEGIKAQQQAYLEAQRELAMQAASITTIFGDDAFGSAMNYLEIYQERTDDVKFLLKQLGTINNLVHNPPGRYVPTQHSKELAALLDLYPKLIDAQGDLDKQYAESLLELETLTDYQKEYIEGLIAAADDAEQALESLNDYFTSMLGEIGSIITNTMVEAFKNGEIVDAASFMANGVQSVLDQMAIDFAHSMAIAPLIKKAQDEVQALIDAGVTGEELVKGIQAIVNGFVEDAPGAQDMVNAILEGFGVSLDTLTSSTGQTGEADAFTTMSQEQGTRLEGIFTALDLKVDAIDEKLAATGGSITEIASDISEINDNTRRSAEALEELVEWTVKVDRNGLKFQ